MKGLKVVLILAISICVVALQARPAFSYIYPIFPPATYIATNYVALSGTVGSSSSVTQRVGTSEDSNPNIGLDFRTSGSISYDYSLGYNIGLGVTEVFAGQTINLLPYLSSNIYGSLTASQDIRFQTDFSFGIDTWLTGDQSFSVTMPDSMSYKSDSVTLGGSGNITNSTSSWTDFGDDLGGVRTSNGRLDAWDVGVDLFALTSSFAPPPVNLVAGIIDGFGFDLDIALGMDIFRNDELRISDYTFDLSAWEVTIPDTYVAGDLFAFSLDDTLDYDMRAYSEFLYGGNIGLDFDGPLFRQRSLVSIDLGDPWRVGINEYSGSGLSAFSFFDELNVVSHADWCSNRDDGSNIFFSYSDCLATNSYNTPTRFVKYAPLGRTISGPLLLSEVTLTPVPEPSTMVLLAFGMIGLMVFHRKTVLQA